MVAQPLGDAPPDGLSRLTLHAMADRVSAWFVRSWPGRTVSAALLIKILTLVIAPTAPVLGLADLAATLVLLVAGLVGLARVLAEVRRRFLWRVRRKLIVSYLFIGFVPVLLVVAFFVLAGVLMFLNVSSFLIRTGFDDLVEEAALLADSSAGELVRGAGVADAPSVLGGKRAAMLARHPDLSLAIVTAAGGAAAAVTGPWRHVEPPSRLPEWIEPNGFGGLVAYSMPGDAGTELVVRAVSFQPADTDYAVVVDIPITGLTRDRIGAATGIVLGRAALVTNEGEVVAPVVGRAVTDVAPPSGEGAGDAAAAEAPAILEGYTLDWVTFVDYIDWTTGRSGQVTTAIEVGLGDFYTRITGAQASLGTVNLGSIFVLVLTVIGTLFLIIEGTAFVMGLALAKSITGSVHELFAGTERVRAGDLKHRIQVRTRDQLGQLAESFNSMTGSIEQLLKQAAEKKRLEEELRIARDIQMSLLPSGSVDMPGVNLTAMCVPAREVGGDYYDFFRLGPDRLGILIADVSGKGTSAAFYMAELKGLVLSLSQVHDSPKQLLIEVNRLISDNLDTRSFITMTYAVLDMAAGALTHARAGHTPLIYLPSGEPTPRAQVLAPDGLVLGLRFDGIAEKFEQLLEEHTLPVGPGDVIALYTDGVSEAMNPESDFFGESRLSEVIEAHGHRSSDDLKHEVLNEVESFVDGAEQHDDMTMILVKVGSAAEASAEGGPVARS
jgi:sigma-B regulation protein RsbU (phosphoserine phosphatase)